METRQPSPCIADQSHVNTLSTCLLITLTKCSEGQVTDKLPEVSFKFLLLDHHTDNRSQYQPVNYCPNNKVGIDADWTKVSQTENITTLSKSFLLKFNSFINEDLFSF